MSGEPCYHPDARLSLEADWVYRCPGCGIAGGGHSPEAAARSFRVNCKLTRGQRLTPAEENVRGYTPAPHGTAAGCATSSRVVVYFTPDPDG